ncbi:MBL fold metallo-hydrolase [Eubacteriaceae bacterium ES3]|nr:MBL fold metallo-hydrolase [Eubacteriaceae bacterium ES3]
MEIEKLSLGSMGTNCYLIWDDNKNGIIIDPGFMDNRVEEIIKDKDLKIKYIVLTHGHFDHLGGVEHLRKLTQAQVLIHAEDSDCLTNPQRNLSYLAGMNLECGKADGYLVESENLKVGDLDFRIIHTPGHSKGGVSLLINKYLFSGDTLFNTSIGRTDFMDGNLDELLTNIREKLLILPDDTIVYPGHGENTTIGYEKLHNPFLQGRY